MSDLQTEIFTKVLPKMKLNELKFDDDAETTVEVVTEQPTTNVTEAIWRFVRDNPGCTSNDVGKNVDGLNGGVSTRIHQLQVKGYLRGTNDRPMKLYVSKPYTPITKEERIANMMQAREKWLENKRNEVKTPKKLGRPPKAAAPVAKPAAPKPVARMVDLNNLSIVEARALYDELKKIFGG